MRRLNIVQVSAYYPPHLGGQENAVADLSQALCRRGHQVTVVTSDQGGSTGQQMVAGQPAVHRLPSRVFGRAPIMPKFVRCLRRLLASDSIVHLHVGQAFTPEMTWLACAWRHRPYILQLHIDFQASGPIGQLLPIYKKWVLGPVVRRAAAVLVLNDQNYNIVQQRYRYQGPLHKISNGIAEDYFKIKRSPPSAATIQLLYVGRLSQQKNLGAALEAIHKLTIPVHFDIVGEGECRPELEAIIRRHQLDQVTLHGRLDRHQVLDFYAHSHALLLPSINEAQPLVLLEAMAARLPIIGTTATGVAEHIKGVGLIGGTTPTEIAASIMEFAATMDKWGPQLKRGFQRASQLRFNKLVQAYEKIYESLPN